MANKYLDYDGVQRLVSKLKTYISNAVKVTGVKGNSESTYRTGNVNLTADNVGALPRNSEIQTTNPFTVSLMTGPYISKIDNSLYAADKRWSVTATNARSGSIASLFDGDYESQLSIDADVTSVITIDFSNTASGYFPGYPYGYYLISFYYSKRPKSISARVYCNYESHGIGWHDITFSRVTGGSDSQHVYRSSHQSYYNISKIEFSITGDGTNSYGYTSITQIEMHSDRPDPKLNPFLSKYGPETLYYNLTAPNFIGNLTGNATSATTAATATRVSCEAGTANAYRHVWFSDSAAETKRAYDDDFKYNPSTNTLTANIDGSINGHTVNSDIPVNAVFTDTVTTASTTGSGNAVTAITASNGALTVTKGATFMTQTQVQTMIDDAIADITDANEANY